MLNSLWDIGTSIGSLESFKTRANPSSASDDFVDAVRKGLEQIVGWLLVFDGLALDSEHAIDAFRRFLPDRSGNNIIYTSVDKTLAHRQRLFNPAAVRVQPLATDEACQLLYHNLEIRRPSSTQQKKAIELVQAHQCLPLAVHAVAHALIENGKQLERYTHDGSSHTRLTKPFMQIIRGLHDKTQYAAIDLITLLSFFNHSVPVALVQFGRKTLSTLDLDVLSPKHPDSAYRDLDSTISILMRCGLLERTLQMYPRSGSGNSSPENSRSFQQHSNGNIPSSERTRMSEETARPQMAEDSSGLEIVLARLNSSADRSSTSSRTSTIDVLRIHSVVQNVILEDLRDRRDQDVKGLSWWLVTAVQLLTNSYQVADEKMRRGSGHGLVRDYREYESHARRMWTFFPRSSKNVPRAVRQARSDLHNTLRMIKREIQNQSPSQSSDNSRRSLPDSVFEHYHSMSETDTDSLTSDLTRASTWSLEPERPPSESPTAIYSAVHNAYALQSGAEEDTAIVSDSDSWPSESETTEVPVTGFGDRSRRSSALRHILTDQVQIKKHKDLGEWKPQPVGGMKSRSSSSQTNSEAEAALHALNQISPKTTLLARTRSSSRSSVDSRPPLAPRSTNTQLSPLAADFSPSEVRERPGSKGFPGHTRAGSSSPRFVQAILNRMGLSKPDVPPLRIDNTQVDFNNAGRGRSSEAHHQSTADERHLPTGYTSVPMSRNTSKESAAGDSGQYLGPAAPQRTFSDPHITINVPPEDYKNAQAYSYDDRQGLSFGEVGGWIESSPVTPTFPTVEHALGERSLSRGIMQFGTMEPVQIEEARVRASIARERSAERRNITDGGMKSSKRQ